MRPEPAGDAVWGFRLSSQKRAIMMLLQSQPGRMVPRKEIRGDTKLPKDLKELCTDPYNLVICRDAPGPGPYHQHLYGLTERGRKYQLD